MMKTNRIVLARSLGIAGTLSVLVLGGLAVIHPRVQARSTVGGEAIEELFRHPDSFKGTATLPVIFCWYKGQPALYIRTDASDASAAAMQGVNFVPQLTNAINAPGGAVDDIYQLTNFKQGNVIPSAPIPAGPSNGNAQYSPLWQVTMVTWNSGVTPYLLKSEEEILSARDAGKLTLDKTNIVVNCPVIFTPFGGQLPTVKIRLSDGDGDDHDHDRR